MLLPSLRRRSDNAERRRRVLMLNWRDRGHPEGGGSEHFIENVAEGLQVRGYEVTLRTAHYPGAPHETWLGGVRVVRRGGRFTVYTRAMAHLLFSRRYDLVVDVQNGVPFWTPLVSRAPRVLLVHHVHREQWSVVFGRVAARLGWWLESRAAPWVYARTRYITVSTTSRRELEELGVDGRRISIVYSGLDRPTRPLEESVRTPWPSLVALGRLVPHKRLHLAIEAVAELREEFPDITLTLIGHGYWEAELRALAERLDVLDQITFTGFVDERTKSRLLAESWLHVLPSLKEGWGLTVVEAASLGTPSVAFRSAGGTTESILDGVTGMLLDDGELLAPRLGGMLRDPALRQRLGETARSYAQQFTWERTVERFEEIAREAMIGGAWQLPTTGLQQPSSPHAVPAGIPRQRTLEPAEIVIPSMSLDSSPQGNV
jgi:glycosyltransferase involved in cell wall biosynthesis